MDVRNEIGFEADEPRTRAVLRRVVDASLTRHEERESDFNEEDEETIVGLDEVGYESSDSNLELQQLGLPPARAKSFAKRFDGSQEVDRTEEIVCIDPTKRPRTLKRHELQEWFSHVVRAGSAGVSDQEQNPQNEPSIPTTFVIPIPIPIRKWAPFLILLLFQIC